MNNFFKILCLSSAALLAVPGTSQNCAPGADSEDMQKRIASFGLAQCGFSYQSYPSVFWDVYGRMGIPLRTTISEMGPLLLGRLMNLTPAQTDVLNVTFKIADDNNLIQRI